MFTVEYETLPHYALCRPIGELDSSTAQQLREALGSQPAPRRLVIDLSQVPFVDSAGLGALIGGIRRTREAGGDVAISAPHREVLAVLRTTGFDRILPVTASVEEAVAALDELDVEAHRPHHA